MSRLTLIVIVLLVISVSFNISLSLVLGEDRNRLSLCEKRFNDKDWDLSRCVGALANATGRDSIEFAGTIYHFPKWRATQ